MRWDREKLLTPDSHVYGENGVEIMVYNVNGIPREGGRKKKNKKERKVEEIQQ